MIGCSLSVFLFVMRVLPHRAVRLHLSRELHLLCTDHRDD